MTALLWSGNSYDNTGHLGASTWRHVLFLEQDRQKGSQVVGCHSAGLGSAAAVLELLGHRITALNLIGFYAAAVETALLIWLSVAKHGAADRAIHEHGAGWLVRIGEVLNEPLALVLRIFGFIP